MTENAPQPISRRDLFRLAAAFGWSSVLLAAKAASGPVCLPELARAAEAIHARRSLKKPAVTLTYGATISGKRLFQINGFGYLEFIRDLEARTDGEIRIEFIPGSEICDEMTCVKKAMQGIVDIYSSSIQNAAGIAPTFDVLNFPCLFPSRAAQHHFFYHPQSQSLLREPLCENHGLILLFTHCRLRGIVMGLKWRDKPDIRGIDDLAGLAVRATASRFGQTALRLLKMTPVPLDWNQTLNALRFGLIDCMETWESAAAGMATEQDVISQVVDLRLFSGNTHAAMRADVFDRLSPALRDAVMESAYFTQIWGQMAGEASLVNTVGASVPRKKGTIFEKQRIRYVALPDGEIEKMERLCSPQHNPKPWEAFREQLNQLAGGVDVYAEIYRIAREIPSATLAENVPPRRWWKG